MATPVIMPRQGQSVESCIIVKWHKKVGDAVKAGDLLFTYETDKASFDEESKIDGIILAIFYQEDADVPVLTNVCVIGDEGEDPSPYSPGGEATEKAIKPDIVAADTAEESEGATKPVPVVAAEGATKPVPVASPRARNLAERAGVDFSRAAGSGPDGRIIEKDIIALQQQGSAGTKAAFAAGLTGTGAGTGLGGRTTLQDIADAEVSGRQSGSGVEAEVSAGDYTEVKLTNIRKVIANAMFASLSTTAQLTLNSSFNAADILEYRRWVKENMQAQGMPNITLNDVLLFAVSRVLLMHKSLNANLVDEKMRYFAHVHLGVAIDTERGLMVPTIFNADAKSISEICTEAKSLVEQCQKGTINPDLLKGGTFTVTNLGGLGVESFTPVLNPPQTGILGVNNITQRFRNEGGAAGFYPAMGLSLTFDHRAVDGAPAARFLKDLTVFLENFRSNIK
ncbi:MAG: dihydrolipoamide acetyltransferase family protein [Eubacteriales bacterium]|nr:dihydrolipoamide acetyltransferase family protein [Eubacteriales bacterium]